MQEEIAAATPRTAKGEPTFAWQVGETQWRLAYSALRQYARREGEATPAASHREELPDTTVGLGQWATLQRYKRRHGQLENRYARWLEALPGWRWEVPLTTTEYGEPLDLGDHPHGTAKGIAAGCTCPTCLDSRRAKDRRHLSRHRAINDGVPASKARRHLTRLQDAGNLLTAIQFVCEVPLGVLRGVSSGRADQISRNHEAALLAVTPAMCARVPTRAASRGRSAVSGNQMIPAGPTWALLNDLEERGFGSGWVARELGYARKLQIGRTRVLRRVADAVAELHTRTGGLTAPPTSPTQSPPPLSELQHNHPVRAGGQR